MATLEPASRVTVFPAAVSDTAPFTEMESPAVCSRIAPPVEETLEATKEGVS